ncbi:hypothetical protein HY224_02800 [Candidatus Uhrbacteria bacterium]|nr:hypothetical protein [Candidatus Uhrbacteria bacterium]
MSGRERHVQNGQQTFEASYQGQELGEFVLKQPGRFNVENALAAMAPALYLGVKPDVIRQALAEFNGTWRRFQVLGQWRDALVISDYAHHPAAVSLLVQATKEFYPGRRVVMAFQPHHHHRTKSLFKEFVESFDGVDVLFMPEIYSVAGRENSAEADISSRDLVQAIKARGQVGSVEYAPDLVKLNEVVTAGVKPDDIILYVGAGDIYLAAEKLIQG